MPERDTHTNDWIAGWIELQREALRRQAASSDELQRESAELGRRWAQVTQTLFGAHEPQAPEGDTRSDEKFEPFNVGAALLGAWSRAASIQSSVAQQVADMLGRLPPVGIAREHTEAWRELAAAYADCKRLEQELREVLLKVQLDALDLLEQRVRERSRDAPIGDFRTLYDLWVDCGEEIYGRLAHSEAYSQLQAQLGNATLRLRARLQTVLERALEQLDLPTRSELNSLHRRVRDLRRELNDLRTARSSAPARKTAPNRTAARQTAQQTKDRRKASAPSAARRQSKARAP